MSTKTGKEKYQKRMKQLRTKKAPAKLPLGKDHASRAGNKKERRRDS